jgi:hypothetical protein
MPMTPMPEKKQRLAQELNKLTDHYKVLVAIAEELRAKGDKANSQAIQQVAFGLQTSQLNLLTSLVHSSPLKIDKVIAAKSSFTSKAS